MSRSSSPTEPSLLAWRRRFECWALLWGARLVAAWAVSRPLAVAVAAGAHADRAVFEPGGLMLLEVLRLRLETVLDALGASALLLLGAWVLLLVVTTGVVARLSPAPETGDLGDRWSAAARALPPVLALSVLAAITAVACAAFVAFVVMTIQEGLPQGSAPAIGEGVLLGGVLLGLLLLAAVGIGFDLIRAHLIRGHLRRGAPNLGAACRQAWATVRRHAGKLAAGRVLTAVASLLVMCATAWLVQRQPVEGASARPVVVVFIVHRLAGGSLAAIQVFWLALIVRSSAARSEPEPARSLDQP